MSNEIAVQEQSAVVTASNNPNMLITMAVEQNADIDKLEKLMGMQERWDAGESKKAFYSAFTVLQSELPRILKTKAGHNCEYAPLSDIVEMIKPHMAKNGFTYRFEQDHSECIHVTCILTHVLGHEERNSMKSLPDESGKKNIVQSIASTVSYLSRYTLTGVLGIATADKDIDGRQPAQENEDKLKKELHFFKLHMDAAKENLSDICEIKDAIGSDDLATAYGLFQEIKAEDKTALWRAPTKGSIWTTDERSIMQSNEWSAARTEYHKNDKGEK